MSWTRLLQIRVRILDYGFSEVKVQRYCCHLSLRVSDETIHDDSSIQVQKGSTQLIEVHLEHDIEERLYIYCT